MIPKIRFIKGRKHFVSPSKLRGKQTKDSCFNFFRPEINTIEMNVSTLLYENGIRNFIACFFHELVHWYQWHFVCHKDSEKWNNKEDIQERQADKIQDFIYYRLLRG